MTVTKLNIEKKSLEFVQETMTLKGTEKQIAWAEKLVAAMVAAVCLKAIATEGNTKEKEIEFTDAFKVFFQETSASKIIDNRATLQSIESMNVSRFIK